jgi:hypothetical protein
MPPFVPPPAEKEEDVPQRGVVILELGSRVPGSVDRCSTDR